MTEYRFASAQDLPKVIDFIDLVFSQANCPHDFARLIPKVYGDGHDYSHIHAIALEDGDIRGAVAVLPYDMTIAGHTLRLGYLGSVSVHRLSRGAGHMKQLMRMQIEKARADGLDMLVLGGQRQRYGYFGFYPVGGSFCYTISHANVRHALKDVDASCVSFEKLEQNEGSDYAYALYRQQAVCGAREKERFAEIARSFDAQGWLVKQNGQNAGYLIAGSDRKEITEIVLEQREMVPAVLKAWMALHSVRYLEVIAAPHNKALNRVLCAFCEEYSIGQDGYALILNHANVLRSWMTLKNSVSPLSEGCVKLAINGETLAVRVADSAVSVEQTSEEADLCLTEEQAAGLLYNYNRFYAPECERAIPADWFPLPFNIMRADTF